MGPDIARAGTERPAIPAASPPGDDDDEGNLRTAAAGIYDIGRADGRWLAYRLRGGPILEAATAGGLEALIAADSERSR